MYKDYFGFFEAPFSIVPSSRYLFLSTRYREAMGHLQAGLGDGGGFAMLTGEVGTGKTTVSKALLASLNDDVKAGLILNPTFSQTDLLEAICDEFSIQYPENATLKQLTQVIQKGLLENHSNGVQSLLLIDEAQHLSTQVLEQLRLLTNLETESQKLLKVLLIGQPELQAKLQTEELRQLAQRITGRYHLLPLTHNEVSQYINFRIRTAGCQDELFTSRAVKIIAQYTQGVPRLINLVCDKALAYAYYSGEKEVTASNAEKASQDIISFQAPTALTRDAKSIKPLVGAVTAIALSISAAFTVMKFEKPIADLIYSNLAPIPEFTDLDKNETSIDQELKSFINQSQDPINTMKTLYHLWGVKASVMDSDCQSVKAPFYCESRFGNLQNIVEEQRAVMLTLRSDFGTFFAILYKVYEDRIELLNGEQRVSLSKEWLTSNWNGEYQLLWYSEVDQVLKLGSQGAEVETLDRLLAEVLGEQAVQTGQFNEQLENRVIAFQTWKGLKADGVVGKQTMKVLDRMTTEFAPNSLAHDPGVK